jgi:predicted component of type VI protein secretion system
MQRNNNPRPAMRGRNRRHKAPIQRRNGRQLQNGSGVGHRDLVRQAKKWQLFETVPFTNATSLYSYGINNVNISTTAAGVASAVYNRLLTQAALFYEEYRVRRVVLRAQPGQGYTNDQRLKTSIFARVDVNSQPTAATLDALNSIISAESCVNRTLTERSNVKLVDYRPICYSTGSSGSSSRPILDSRMQWYNIDERDAHLWRGATVAPVIPEPGLSPNSLAVTVWAEVEVEFRSRRPDFANFSSPISIETTVRDSPDRQSEQSENE